MPLINRKDVQDQLKQLIRENRHASSRDHAARGVIVDGRKLSVRSVQRMLPLISRRVGITPRPMITDQKHADAAMADAQSLLTDDFTMGAHTDEKIFVVPGYNSKVCINILPVS